MPEWHKPFGEFGRSRGNDPLGTVAGGAFAYAARGWATAPPSMAWEMDWMRAALLWQQGSNQSAAHLPRTHLESQLRFPIGPE